MYCHICLIQVGRASEGKWRNCKTGVHPALAVQHTSCGILVPKTCTAWVLKEWWEHWHYMHLFLCEISQLEVKYWEYYCQNNTLNKILFCSFLSQADLKVISDAKGGTFYRDHLPLLGQYHTGTINWKLRDRQLSHFLIGFEWYQLQHGDLGCLQHHQLTVDTLHKCDLSYMCSLRKGLSVTWDDLYFWT